MITKTFFYPTFGYYLLVEFGLSTSESSIFFVLNMASYFILIQFIERVTSRLGIKFTITLGLFFSFVGCLFLPPISIFPKYNINLIIYRSLVVIVIGLLILGIPGAFINIPAIVDLIETFKVKMKLDETQSHDLSSAVYNLGLNAGEAFGPTLGGFVTNKASFKASCIITGLLSLFYAAFFGYINYNVIQKDLEQGDKSGKSSMINNLKDDDFYADKKAIGGDRKVEVEYVGRYRSMSYSNRSSARGSYSDYSKVLENK